MVSSSSLVRSPTLLNLRAVVQGQPPQPPNGPAFVAGGGGASGGPCLPNAPAPDAHERKRGDPASPRTPASR